MRLQCARSRHSLCRIVSAERRGTPSGIETGNQRSTGRDHRPHASSEAARQAPPRHGQLNPQLANAHAVPIAKPQPKFRASAPCSLHRLAGTVTPWQTTTPNVCASLSMSIIPMPRASGSYRTTCRPTRPAPSNEAFAPAEARRILRRLEFHYTPKHASWLNMAEIEVGVLRGQCLDCRTDDPTRLISEIATWEQQRNAAGARIKWMFTTEKARAKMGRAYPITSKDHYAKVLEAIRARSRACTLERPLDFFATRNSIEPGKSWLSRRMRTRTFG